MGVKIANGIYKDGKKNGVWFNYFLPMMDAPYKNYSGKVSAKTTYANGVKNGIQEIFGHMDFGNQKEPGFLKIYYEKTTYTNGILNGLYQYKDSLNRLVAIGKYMNGKNMAHGHIKSIKRIVLMSYKLIALLVIMCMIKNMANG